MRQYVIIGAGAAGVAAAEAIRSQDSTGRIILLSEEAEGYYSRPGLAFYLTGELPEAQLFPFATQDFRRLGVQSLHGRATRIQPQLHRVELENGYSLSYDRLLIATGAAALRLTAPGSQAQGVVKLDCLQDARHILHLARKQREAVVVGGGITALEIVEGLVTQGVKVHYLLRGDRYWSNVLDETESRIVEQRLKEDKVHLHFRSEIAEVLTDGNRVAGVRTPDGRRYSLWNCCSRDRCAAAQGAWRRIGFAGGARFDCGRVSSQ